MGRTTVVPLGGLGEIGLNALAVESGEDLILIDCGLMFPRGEYSGVDYLIPDLAFLRERRDRLRGVLLTHGHDDHVGAVGHLLETLRVPVYGTGMTLAAAAGRCAGRVSGVQGLLRPVLPGSAVELGPFRAHFHRVTHSVPEACAIAVETPGGVLLHTGDFHFDPTPVDGRPADEAALAAWGERGVDLLCCDSTNALVEGATPSERAVGVALRRWLPRVTGRAYVALFASNVHRIQQLLEVSRETGRRVAFLGRSVTQSARVARRLGHLRAAPGDVIPEAHASRLPREELTVVLGGSQAEPGSALWRVARGMEPAHRVLPGDALFLCARRIPGNEVAIQRLANRCVRQGASVYFGDVHGVHASGHPAAEDLGRMFRLTRPSHVLPVHGELYHLDALATRAEAAGIPPAGVFRVENGQTLILGDRAVQLGDRVATGRVVVDAGEEVGFGAEVLEERRRLGRGGLLVAAVGDGHGGAPPTVRVQLRGVFAAGRAGRTALALEAELAAHLASEPAVPGAREREVRRLVHRHFRRHGLRCPVVIVVSGEPEGAVDSSAPGPVE
jgi:ribonuclease J